MPRSKSNSTKNDSVPTAVTISGISSGVDRKPTASDERRRSISTIPSAASMANAVPAADAATAMRSEVHTASRTSSRSRTSRYQTRLKPSQRDTMGPLLKEYTTTTASGAYKNANASLAAVPTPG